jgi:Xaa-Pro aminopeptidase
VSEQEQSVIEGYEDKINKDKELVFTPEEYKERLDRIRKVMARKNVDLIYVTAPESICYISGYQSIWYQANGPKTWLPLSGIAVHVNHDKFILFELPEHTLTIEKQTVSTDTRYLDFCIVPIEDATSFIISELKSEGWLGGTVGLEMSCYRPPRTISEKLQSALEGAGCRVTDATDIVREARAVKSPQEIAYIEKAAEIADLGLEAMLGFLKPGVSSLEIYGELINAMAKAGGEISGLPPGIYGGWQLMGVHSMPSRTELERGDLVCVDPGGVYNRYHADIARTFSFGEPDPELSAIGEFSEQSMSFVKEMIRPNLPVDEFNQKLKAFYEEAGMLGQGYWVGGYEMGIAFPPDWVGPFVYELYLDPGDAVFCPGTTVQFENAVGVIDTMVFTEKEAKLLGKMPYGLTVIE